MKVTGLGGWVVAASCALSAGPACADRAAGRGVASATTQPATGVGRFFPLEDGKIYHYQTRDGEEQGMLVVKVRRTGPTTVELAMSNGTKRLETSAEGVAYVGGPFVLKAPLEVGATWPGEHGGTTRISDVDARVDVPAGPFSGCVTTVEKGEKGDQGPGQAVRPSGTLYESSYCPGVGLARLVVRSAGHEARAELRSYAYPVKIE